jgi:hypothetical protein
MDENTENTQEPVVYSDDPFIDASLRRLDKMAAEYRAQHAAQTAESESVDYLLWKSIIGPMSDEESEAMPDSETLANFLWEDATAAQLLHAVSVLDEMRDTVNRRMRMLYNASRGVEEAPTETVDLSAMRAKLIIVLDSTLVNIEAGMFEGMTEDMIYGLPSIGPKIEQDRVLKDGSKALVWNFDKAPRSKSDAPKSNGGKSLRRNNTTVRILINGADPQDYPESNELGDACGKYLKCSVQDAAKLFNDWADKENPRIFERDGTWYGLTSKPRAPKA